MKASLHYCPGLKQWFLDLRPHPWQRVADKESGVALASQLTGRRWYLPPQKPKPLNCGSCVQGRRDENCISYSLRLGEEE